MYVETLLRLDSWISWSCRQLQGLLKSNLEHGTPPFETLEHQLLKRECLISTRNRMTYDLRRAARSDDFSGRLLDVQQRISSDYYSRIRSV